MTAEERFAANLKAARLAAGLSQEKLSWLAEVHRSQISSFERGLAMPRARTLLKLAGSCGVSVDDLLAGIGEDV